jgi:hypothetical protein
MVLLNGGLLAGLRLGSIVVNHGTGTPVACARQWRRRPRQGGAAPAAAR